jgi:hypothetical protein
MQPQLIQEIRRLAGVKKPNTLSVRDSAPLRYRSKARAVTLNVFRIGEHARLTDISLVIASIIFPFRHIVEPGAKLLASNPFNDLLAAITCNFD